MHRRAHGRIPGSLPLWYNVPRALPTSQTAESAPSFARPAWYALAHVACSAPNDAAELSGSIVVCGCAAVGACNAPLHQRAMRLRSVEVEAMCGGDGFVTAETAPAWKPAEPPAGVDLAALSSYLPRFIPEAEGGIAAEVIALGPPQRAYSVRAPP